MEHFFHAISGPLNKFVDCVYLSILWFFCSIPIFTIGASTAALYYTVQKSLLHDRSYPGKEFFRCFRQNFKQATLIWLGILVFALAMLFGAYMSSNGLLPDFFLYIYIAVFAVLVILAIYVFPYLSRFEGTLREIILNSFTIGITNFGKTLLSVLLIAAAAVAVWVFFPLIFLLPGLIMYAVCSMFEKIFEKYLSEEAKEAEFNRNREWHNG